MKNDQISLTFYPNKLKYFLFLMTTTIFTWGGIWTITEISKKENASLLWLAWIITIFFAISSFALFINLLPNSCYLRISNKGFEIRTLFRNKFASWDEVEPFEFGYMESQERVLFHYTSKYLKRIKTDWLSQKIAKTSHALPDNYGKSPEELSNLLNEWKNKNSVNLLRHS